MSSGRFRELIEDLQVERHKLAKLVASLEALQRQWRLEGGTEERVDAAAGGRALLLPDQPRAQRRDARRGRLAPPVAAAGERRRLRITRSR